MTAESQLDLFGGQTPLEELDWPPLLRLLANEERELGARLAADEAGAIIHAKRGRHDREARCDYCAIDGREALARLLNRAPLERAAEQTRSPRLADDSAASSSARARTTDPATSHAAARSIPAGQLRDSQEAILRLFRELGPMTDELLVERYQDAVDDGLRPSQSPSGIRTRRDELTGQGRLRDSGRKTRTRSGQQAIVWELSSPDDTPPPEEYDPEPDL